MRVTDIIQESLFTVAKLEDFVLRDHPLRAVRTRLACETWLSLATGHGEHGLA